MNSRMIGLLAVVAVLPLAASAEDVKSARGTLSKGIIALGGTKLLSGERALTGSSQGTITIEEKTMPANNEWTVQGLDQARWAASATIDGNKATFVVILNGDKAWISANDQPGNPIDKEMARPFSQVFAGLRLSETLVPLTGKEWKLSSLGELKIGGKPAIGIKATKKGFPPLDIFFDAKTHLPVQAEMRVTESSGREAVYLAKFGEYRKFGERQHFTKLTVLRDGTEVVKMERNNIEAKKKVEDDTFAKP